MQFSTTHGEVFCILGRSVYPHTLEFRIAYKRVFILVNRPAMDALTSGRQDECRLAKLSQLVESINAIYCAWELPRKPVAVNRGCQNQHVSLIQQRILLLHVVELHTFPRPLFTAVIACGTTCNMFQARVLYVDLVTCSARHPQRRSPFHHFGSAAPGHGLPFSTSVLMPV